MRIAIASSGLGHVARGIEAWAADLGRALADRGEDVLLCKGGGAAQAPYERVVSCWQREEPRTGRLVRRIPRSLGWRVGFGSPYKVEESTFAWNLIGLLRREKVDILHVQDPTVALRIQQARALGLVRARAILGHGTEEPVAFQRRIDYLQHLAPCHLEESRAQGAWKPAWTAIPNFIDTESFRPGSSPSLRAELGIPDDAVVVLTAAAIKRHHKRIDHLIAEFARLRADHPGLPAYLVVAGGWETETDALVAEGRERLGDRVRFLVRFPRERMADLYRAADLFVLCSLKEMMPIALLEATATGLGCVVNHAPIFEWITGPGGLAVDMAAPGALAAALAELVADPGRRRDLGGRARSYCVENFGRDRVVDRILEYYRAVLADGPARTPRPARAAGESRS